MGTLETLLTSLVGASATSGLIIWLAKSWISTRLEASIRHEYDLKLETFKNELQAKAEISGEKLRSQLQIEAARRNIEHSRIHDKRLEIISELAAKLDKLISATSAYVSPFGTPNEDARKALADAFGEVLDYYRPRKFFLERSTNHKIIAFTMALRSHSMDVMIYVEQKVVNRTVPAKDIEVWSSAAEYVSAEAPKLIEALEDDFRKLLGIGDEPSREQ